jgi:PIN domain nuclease of toxin-antitoxin system
MGRAEVTVLLDTHAALWLATDDEQLGKRTRSLIEAATRDSALAISAISFWEIALLITKGRLQSTVPATELRNRLLQAGISEIPLSGDIALASTDLTLHGDPADRFIAASAISLTATLVTADEKLLAWKNALKRQDARR